MGNDGTGLDVGWLNRRLVIEVAGYSGTPLAKKLGFKVALPLGLVDVKVCAVDDIWSGLKLVIRKEFRK